MALCGTTPCPGVFPECWSAEPGAATGFELLSKCFPIRLAAGSRWVIVGDLVHP
jgi:hypothetical protein